MKQNRREFLKASAGVTAVAATSALGIPAVVRAQRGPVTVRLGDVTPTDNPEYAAHQFFATRIAEATKGAYEVKIFPNSVLGGHTQMLR
jgi:TRAP-type C4-dicarboxylate transport system substrate-binding protein